MPVYFRGSRTALRHNSLEARAVGLRVWLPGFNPFRKSGGLFAPGVAGAGEAVAGARVALCATLSFNGRKVCATRSLVGAQPLVLSWGRGLSLSENRVSSSRMPGAGSLRCDRGALWTSTG